MSCSYTAATIKTNARGFASARCTQPLDPCAVVDATEFRPRPLARLRESLESCQPQLAENGRSLTSHVKQRCKVKEGCKKDLRPEACCMVAAARRAEAGCRRRQRSRGAHGRTAHRGALMSRMGARAQAAQVQGRPARRPRKRLPMHTRRFTDGPS